MVTLTRYERLSAFLTGQTYQRQRRQVKNDLQMKHMVPAGLTKGRLGKLSPEKYGAYMEVLEIIGRKFPKLEISSRRLSGLEKINLEGVDKKKLAYRVAAGIEGGSLKLEAIRRVAAEMQRESLLRTTFSKEVPPDPVRTMIDMIIEEKRIFERIVAQPEASIEDIFFGLKRAIEKGKLPFLNISIYRPLSDGRWTLFSHTRDWSGASPSKYINGGAYPSTTLKSVIMGAEEMYDVDIKDPTTFKAAGLVADRSSVRNDLQQSKGSGRTLFIKLISRFGAEAVVQIHNRVGKEEDNVPRELLPADEREALRIKEQLREYFQTIVRAIEVVRGRQLKARPMLPMGKEGEGEESQKLFSPTQYFGGSAMYRSGRYTTEYNDNPAKNYARIRGKVLGDLDGIVADVLGEPLPRKEMEDHALYVNHSFTDRVGEEVTGFATSDEHSDYINARGKHGRLIYYAGIMVKKAHRGGRTAYLTFRMMLKIFKNLGLAKLLFGRTPLVYRTQDRRIHKLGIRYYSAKSDPREFTEEDWNAVRFTARKYGWELVEGTNICRQVYNKRLVDKPEQLLPGLGELDASVCVGNASCRSPLMLLWDVFVKKRVQFNGDKPSVRVVA